jgi:hypothetical protein
VRIRRSSRNVKRWQSGDMCLRWTAARMPEADRQFRRIIGYAKLAVAIERQLDQTRAPPRPKGRYARHHIALTPGPPSRRIHGDRDISIETQKVSPARDDQQEPAHSFRFLPQSAIAEVPRRLKSRAALAVVAPTCKSPEAQLAGRDARRAVAAGTAVAGDDMSQAVEESEERVWRAVAAGLAVQRLGARGRSFFEREVGVEVHLRGFDLFVSEPERDHAGVDAVPSRDDDVANRVMERPSTRRVPSGAVWRTRAPIRQRSYDIHRAGRGRWQGQRRQRRRGSNDVPDGR